MSAAPAVSVERKVRPRLAPALRVASSRLVRTLIPPTRSPTLFPRRDRLPADRATPPGPLVHASEGGAAAVEAKRPLFPSLAMLLAGHVLRDGEVVLLILKPSLWFIVFATMRFAAAMGILIIGAVLWAKHPFVPYYIEAGVFAILGRAMWATLQWMGRLYVLTDLRVLRLSGVFTVDIFDCPLRGVGQTRVSYSFRERLWRLGSIEILPRDETRPPGVWQTVRKPNEVHEEILAAIRKAKNGGAGEWD